MTKLKTPGNLRSIGIALLGCLLAALVFFNAGCNSSKEQKPIKIMVNQEFGYEFEYPTSWQKLKNAESVLGEGMSGSIGRNKPFVVAGVRVVSLKDDDDFDSLVQSLDKKMPESLKDFKKEDDEFLKINGEKVLRYSYTFKSDNGAKIKQMQQIASKDKRAYYFIFHAASDSFDSVQPEIEQIANTFKLK